jgi:hypothetical protein
MALNGFLNEQDSARFSEFHVGRRYASSDRRGEKAHSPATAAKLVWSALAGGGGFVVDQKILAIQGAGGSGLTWAAQEIFEAVLKSEPPWKKMVLLDDRCALSAMIGTVDWKPVYRALRSGGGRIGGALALRAFALLLFLASLAVVAEAGWLASGVGAPAEVGRPLLLLAGSFLLGLVWWITRKWISARMSRRLAALLSAPGLDEKAVLAAGRVLGRDLAQAQEFLVLIVDGYSRLMPVARTAIIEALRTGGRSTAVTWFVFDSDIPGLFRKDLAGLHECGLGGLSTMTCEMLPLAIDERARVVEVNGLACGDAQSETFLFEALRKKNGAEERASTSHEKGLRASA